MFEFKLYHYNMEDFYDVGFGCSYRNIQTILSSYKFYYNKYIKIPVVTDILFYFNKNYQDIIKKKSTKDLWIEPYQIYQYLSTKFKINGKNIIYILDDQDISKMLKTDINIYLPDNLYNINNFDKILTLFNQHFEKSKLPIVIDNGFYSYLIGNIDNKKITIIDPHQFDDNCFYQKDISYLHNSFWMIFIPE